MSDLEYEFSLISPRSMTRISFVQSSRRLYSDAEHLFADTAADRSMNAAHFHGLASECGLKYLLLLCGGLQRDSTTGDLSGRRDHVGQMVGASGLATNYEITVSGHTHYRYLRLLNSISSLKSWRAEYRYYDKAHGDYPKADESLWRSASKEIQSALDMALLDGQPIY